MSAMDLVDVSAAHVPEQIPTFLILLISELFLFRKKIPKHYVSHIKKGENTKRYRVS